MTDWNTYWKIDICLFNCSTRMRIWHERIRKGKKKNSLQLFIPNHYLVTRVLSQSPLFPPVTRANRKKENRVSRESSMEIKIKIRRTKDWTLESAKPCAHWKLCALLHKLSTSSQIDEKGSRLELCLSIVDHIDGPLSLLWHTYEQLYEWSFYLVISYFSCIRFIRLYCEYIKIDYVKLKYECDELILCSITRSI